MPEAKTKELTAEQQKVVDEARAEIDHHEAEKLQVLESAESMAGRAHEAER